MKDLELSDEKILKKEGEELASISVESKLGAKQLRTIYTLTKTKPLPFVEAFIQHQLARVSGIKAWELALNLLKKYGDDKVSFSKILMYANMLYDYYERQAAMQYFNVAEEAARKICEQQRCKYIGLELSTRRDQTEARVRVSGYRGDRKDLAFSIKREITQKDPTFQGIIWIEQVDRR
jgi:hypothetical protein